MSIIFFVLAAAFNAAMDILTHHWHVSVFKNLPDIYFNPYVSWYNKYKIKNVIIRYLWTPISDAWHLFKALMLICLILSIIYYNILLLPVLDIFIYLIIWGLSFELFYFILKNKKVKNDNSVNRV